MHTFRLKDPGEGIHEAEILEVRVSEGDDVEEGEIVLVIETDKAAVEVPAPYTGSVSHIAVAEGDVVEVGSELMRFNGAARSDQQDSSDQEQHQENDQKKHQKKERRDKPAKPAKHDNDEGSQSAESDGEDRAKLTADDDPASDSEGAARPPLASPAARRLARERGVELEAIPGSGPDGRVLVDDIRTEDAEPASEVDEERVPLRSVRRATARRMKRAWEEIPHVTHTVHADITDLERFRESRKGDFPYLTLTVLLLKALSAALRRHPRFNASLDDDDIVIKHGHHFGVAVDTDRGLLVPVLRNVDRQDMRSLSSMLEEMVNKARGGVLSVDEMRGGTFTITNIGAAGASHFTPIINPPQAAILGVATAELRQVANEATDADVQWQARRLLPLILTFDHRLNDGMDAARFMAVLSDSLKSPESLLAAM